MSFPTLPHLPASLHWIYLDRSASDGTLHCLTKAYKSREDYQSFNAARPRQPGTDDEPPTRDQRADPSTSKNSRKSWLSPASDRYWSTFGPHLWPFQDAILHEGRSESHFYQKVKAAVEPCGLMFWDKYAALRAYCPLIRWRAECFVFEIASRTICRVGLCIAPILRTPHWVIQ